ncbi:MAG: ATP-binding cassette domain-containing protein [Actinomycetota bacterium]
MNLEVRDGDLVLVAGASGAGKSTLLRIPPGLVPHHSGGTFSGRVTLDGRDITGAAPRDLAASIGFVPQDPEAHATSDRVIPELAFAMENLGTPPTTMRKRIEEVLDALGIAHLRDRRLDTLSGGERQRVAIAAVLTAQPRLLILDEPTSALDPQSSEDVFSVLGRLRDELGLTILCAEHRLERVVAFSDQVAFLPIRSGGQNGAPPNPPTQPLVGGPREVFAHSAFAPPVSVLGRKLGWSPLPLTVREGRAFAAGVRSTPPHTRWTRTSGENALSCDGLGVSAGGREVVRGVSLELKRGEIAALVGRNGAGKTTLLRALAGLVDSAGGTITLGDKEVGRKRDRDTARRIAFVPQRAEMLLFRDSVRAELEMSAPGPAEARVWLRRLGLSEVAHRHPWTLSAGQRLWTALGTAFVRSPDVYLLDEPTRGLDPPGKDRLAAILREKADDGAAVLLVTHDVELVARTADRVHMLAEGDVVASGPVREVLGESLLFSSQTSKVMGDARFLTPDDVVKGLPPTQPPDQSGAQQ